MHQSLSSGMIFPPCLILKQCAQMTPNLSKNKDDPTHPKMRWVIMNYQPFCFMVGNRRTSRMA